MDKRKHAITVGVFDMLHEGHFNLFRRLLERGENVSVFVHDDRSTCENKGRFPVQSTVHRYTNVMAAFQMLGADMLYVTVAHVFDANPAPALAAFWERQRYRGDAAFVRGDDMPDFPARREVEALGWEVELVPYTKGVSSTARRERECL